MAMCQICLGEGQHDHRMDDAWFSEHHTNEQLEAMRAGGLVHPVGVVPCGECEGTGVISQERYDDLYAAARAAVDQIAAKLRDESPPPSPRDDVDSADDPDHPWGPPDYDLARDLRRGK